MNTQVRLLAFVVFGLGCGALVLWGAWGLPGFGNYPGPYGDLINSLGVPERHVTDMATAVNFDFRGFDTLGEEYILFASVAGVTLLLRKPKEHSPQAQSGSAKAKGDRSPGSTPRFRSDAVHWVIPWLIGATLVFGIDIVIHAHLTPGGGFQGGVILAAGLSLVYLVMGYDEFHRLSPKVSLEVADAVGAGSYALIGIATWLAGGAFLENMLPLGKTGELLSGGTIPLINLAVGLEVTAGFSLLAVGFLKDLHEPSEERPQ
jgi:multicomponent Na+:H+ antiporter subunit B